MESKETEKHTRKRVCRCYEAVKAMIKQKLQDARNFHTNREKQRQRKAKCSEWQNFTEAVGPLELLSWPESDPAFV